MISYFKSTIEIIQDCFENFSQSEFDHIVDRCVETIKNGGKIVASGLGKNVPICEKFVGTLNSFGIDARFLHTNTAIHGDLGVVQNKDILFILSKSGNTIESVLLSDFVKAKNCEVWYIGFNKESQLAQKIDNQLILSMKHEGDIWDIAPNNSTTIYLILLQGIAIELSKRLDIKLDDFKINHPGGGIGQKLSK